MKGKTSYIFRQLLVGIIALQLLNVSIGNQAWDADYDYSYTYNKTYDPTETALEWIVEMEYGQKADFSYDNHADTNKNLIKAFHWQTDRQEIQLEAPYQPIILTLRGESPEKDIPSHPADIISPPPEPLIA